jgi:hypothetical protein
VKGTGFPVTSPISIYLGAVVTQPFTTTSVMTTGTFTKTFPMPAEWPVGEPIPPGPLPVMAVPLDQSFQVTTTFTYTVP